MKTRRGRRSTRRRSMRRMRKRTMKRGGGYTFNMSSGGIAGMPIVDKVDGCGADGARGGNNTFAGGRRRKHRKQRAGGSALEMQSPIAGYGFTGQSVRPGAEVFQSIY